MTDNLPYSTQCLALPTHQAGCIPFRTKYIYGLRPARNIAENKRPPTPSHQVRVPLKRIVRPLDSLPRERITTRELVRPTGQMADQIIEIPEKTTKSVRSPEDV
jgi:hypothetical protein